MANVFRFSSCSYLGVLLLLLLLLYFRSPLNNNSIKTAHLETSGPFLISHQSSRLVLTDALHQCCAI